MSTLAPNRQAGSKKVGTIAGFESPGQERDCRSLPKPFERKENIELQLPRLSVAHPLLSLPFERHPATAHREGIQMKGYRKIIMVLAIGGCMALAVSAGLVSAGETDEGASGSGAALRQGAVEFAGGQAESEYAYRNAWSRRNEKQNRYGDMGEDAPYARGRGFVDENGDGINDLAPDHDGDGVPNCQDPDWVKNKRDGTGNKYGQQRTEGGRGSERSSSRGGKGAQAVR